MQLEVGQTVRLRDTDTKIKIAAVKGNAVLAYHGQQYTAFTFDELETLSGEPMTQYAPPPMPQGNLPPAGSPANIPGAQVPGAGGPPSVQAPPPAQPAKKTEADVLAMIPQQVTNQGHHPTPDQAKAFYDYLVQELVDTGTPADRVADTLYNRLAVETYECDPAYRSQTTQQAPEAGQQAVSDSTEPPNPGQDPAPGQEPAPSQTPPAETKEGLSVEALTCRDCGQVSTGKTLRGLKTHIKKTHGLDWGEYCMKHSLDKDTGLPKEGTQVATGSSLPDSEPPAEPGATSMPVPTNPEQAPAQQQSIGFPSQPTPPPTAQVTQAPAVAAGVQTPAAPSYAQGPTAGVPTAPQANNAPAMPNPAAPPQEVAPVIGMSRAERAEMLGGAVRVVCVKLEDLGKVDLTGYTDLIQMQKLAEKQACDQLGLDVLADGKYAKGSQTAVAVFARMLSQTPAVYLTRDGFDTLLGSEYLMAVLARATEAYFYIKGQPVTLNLP